MCHSHHRSRWRFLSTNIPTVSFPAFFICVFRFSALSSSVFSSSSVLCGIFQFRAFYLIILTVPPISFIAFSVSPIYGRCERGRQTYVVQPRSGLMNWHYANQICIRLTKLPYNSSVELNFQEGTVPTNTLLAYMLDIMWLIGQSTRCIAQCSVHARRTLRPIFLKCTMTSHSVKKIIHYPHTRH